MRWPPLSEKEKRDHSHEAYQRAVYSTAYYTYDEASLNTKPSDNTIYYSIVSGNLITSGAGKLHLILGENFLAQVRVNMQTGRLSAG